MNEKIREIAKILADLTPDQAKELSKILEDEYGIEPMKDAVVITTTEIESPVKEEQTVFDIILKSAGPSKLKVVKAIKELTSMGLIESKKLVDEAPVTIKQGIPKDEADSLKTQLEAEGAEIEIK